MFSSLVWASLLFLLASCGWKGEPIPEPGKESAETDTVYNDMTYSSVTGKVSRVSAVAATLTGYVNGAISSEDEYVEFGFLLSRFVKNPSYEDADKPYGDGGGRVRRIVVPVAESDNSISARAQGLLPFTQFFFRTYIVHKSGKISYGIVKTFKTLDMSVSMGRPERIGMLSADFVTLVHGLTEEDYNDSAFVSFRCVEGSMNFPSDVFDASERLYDSTIVIKKPTRITEYRAGFKNLVPGKPYSVSSFVTVCSDFYKYSEDNPTLPNGLLLYGHEPSNIRTDHYSSTPLEFTAVALNGVAAFPGTDVGVDYDLAEVKDCYFTLPIDTIFADEYGLLLTVGDFADGNEVRTIVSTDALRAGNKYNVIADSLLLNTLYSYKSYVKVLGLTFVSIAEYKFSTKDYTPKYVDMGLSVCWADRNIGAYDPEISGGYFSWGEISSKNLYDDESYIGPAVDVMSIEGPEYDVATAKWGEGWRLPTPAEVDELFDECDWEWTKVNGVYGYLITSPNDNEIFLPAAGLKRGSEICDASTSGVARPQGYYWTSQRRDATTGLVWDMSFTAGMKTDPSPNKRPLHYCKDMLGLTVRPVYVGQRH